MKQRGPKRNFLGLYAKLVRRLRTIIFPIDFNDFLRFRGSMLGGKIGLEVLEGSWGVLEASEGVLEASWGTLWRSWKHFRASSTRLDGGLEAPRSDPGVQHASAGGEIQLMSSLKGDMEL